MVYLILVKSCAFYMLSSIICNKDFLSVSLSATYFSFPLASVKFLSSSHPLGGHFRAALRREGCSSGCIPVSVIAIYDAKINNICKYINPVAELNTLLVMSLVLRAAAKLTDVLQISDKQLSLQRRSPYPPEIICSTNNESNLVRNIPVELIRIPASLGKPVEPLMLNITTTGYYLDIIARELEANEASDVLISR